MDEHRITGLILAGGRASRMNGCDKGLLTLAGRPLVAHVLERFAPQVDRVLISANRNREIYAAFGHPVVADVIEGYAGPLAGLHAGLRACATPLLATAPCDAPLLPDDLVARLRAALGDGIAAVAAADERIEPAFLLCRREVVADLERYVAGGGRRIHTWLKEIGATVVPFAAARTFTNVNTPEELSQLESGS